MSRPEATQTGGRRMSVRLQPVPGQSARGVPVGVTESARSDGGKHLRIRAK